MIAAIWHWLFHKHRWEIHSKSNLTVFSDSGRREERGTLFVLRCMKCGAMKTYSTVWRWGL